MKFYLVIFVLFGCIGIILAQGVEYSISSNTEAAAKSSASSGVALGILNGPTQKKLVESTKAYLNLRSRPQKSEAKFESESFGGIVCVFTVLMWPQKSVLEVFKLTCKESEIPESGIKVVKTNKNGTYEAIKHPVGFDEAYAMGIAFIQGLSQNDAVIPLIKDGGYRTMGFTHCCVNGGVEGFGSTGNFVLFTVLFSTEAP